MEAQAPTSFHSENLSPTSRFGGSLGTREPSPLSLSRIQEASVQVRPRPRELGFFHSLLPLGEELPPTATHHKPQTGLASGAWWGRQRRLSIKDLVPNLPLGLILASTKNASTPHPSPLVQRCARGWGAYQATLTLGAEESGACLEDSSHTEAVLRLEGPTPSSSEPAFRPHSPVLHACPGTGPS